MEWLWRADLILCSALHLDLLGLKRAKDAPFSPTLLGLTARATTRHQIRRERRRASADSARISAVASAAASPARSASAARNAAAACTTNAHELAEGNLVLALMRPHIRSGARL